MRKFFDEDSPNALRDQVRFYLEFLSNFFQFIDFFYEYFRDRHHLELDHLFPLIKNVECRLEASQHLQVLKFMKAMHKIKW